MIDYLLPPQLSSVIIITETDRFSYILFNQKEPRKVMQIVLKYFLCTFCCNNLYMFLILLFFFHTFLCIFHNLISLLTSFPYFYQKNIHFVFFFFPEFVNYNLCRLFSLRFDKLLAYFLCILSALFFNQQHI